MEVITFYSYKGGSGRSSTTLNTLPYLAEILEADKNAPILVLDMDLDSAGMTYLLELEKHFQDKDVFDVKKFLRGDENWSEALASNLFEHSLYKKFVPVGEKLGVENEAIVFLGVNDGIKIDNSEMSGAKEELFKKLRRFCTRNKFSAIVIDSSAGDQFSAILSIQAATLVVHCLRVTTQFRTGTFSYLYRLQNECLDKRIVLLPTVVPQSDRQIDGVWQRHDVVEDILKRIADLKLNNIKKDFLNLENLGINEVDRFKWREGVLFNISKTQELSEDEVEATKRYRKLAQIIAAGDYEL